MYDNSSLPKLLAKENISIRHGNYQTPWFDIKNRVLGLPLWKDMGKDVYDLFVGHEVGHALETPYEGWHDSPEKLQGCPRSYINVIEDARIERKIKARYPGLVGPFSRAYATLYDDNFFSTEDLDFAKLRIIDKINLQAKVGAHVDIEFNDEEQVFMDRAMSTNDFQEVLELVKDIVEYDKQFDDEDEEPNTPEDDNEEQLDEPQFNDDSGDGQGDNESEDKDETPNSSGDNDEKETDSEEQEVEISSKGADGRVSITDEAFRNNESSLLDTNEHGEQILTLSDINKELRKRIVIDYKTLQKDRDYKMQHADPYTKDNIDMAMLDYGSYMKAANRSVAVAVKEFEMRKAAVQWQKATTAKTGIIDVNKLFSYKTNDDIFLQTTRLHDAKNHGMMMLIDYSGSMSESLPHVLDQLIHLVLFCKKVNIPFEVYAFTTTNQLIDSWDLRDQGLLFDGDLDLDNIAMPLLISSKLKKSDFENALTSLYLRSKIGGWSGRDIISNHEDWGSTPLDQALIMSHHLIKDFKSKNQVEKMNLVVFSDGESNSMRGYSDKSISDNKVETNLGYSAINIMVDGKLVKAEGRKSTTKSLLENLRSRYGINCIGFFMADNSRMFNSKVDDIVGMSWAEESRKEAQKEYRKNKCVVRTDALGYNEFYLIKGGSQLATEDDEFGVNSDQTRGQMASAFKKYSKSKKQNKVLMTTFGRAVA